MIGVVATMAALASPPLVTSVEAESAPIESEATCASGVTSDDVRLLRDELSAMRAELDAQRAELKRLREPVAALVAPSTGPRTAYGSPAVVEAGATVDEVTAFGDDVHVRGHVIGDATSFGGDVIVEEDGIVEGDATSFGGQVAVEEGGIVHGDRVAFADEPSAVGSSVWATLDDLRRRAVLLLSFAGAGVLVVGLAPNRVARVAAAIDQHPGRSFLVGAAASSLLVVTSVLFAVTIVGLPVSFLLMAVLGLAWLMGFVGLCHAMGDRLPFAQKHHGRWVAFAIGSALVAFAGSLPWVGWIVVFGGSLVGLGGSLRSRFGR